MCIISVYIFIGNFIYSMYLRSSHNIKSRQTINGCGYTIYAFIYIYWFTDFVRTTCSVLCARLLICLSRWKAGGTAWVRQKTMRDVFAVWQEIWLGRRKHYDIMIIMYSCEKFWCVSIVRGHPARFIICPRRPVVVRRRLELLFLMCVYECV